MIGQRLKLARRERGLTQGEVSETIKRPQSIISKLENNELEPSLEMLISLKRLYNTTYEFILEGKKTDKKTDKKQ